MLCISKSVFEVVQDVPLLSGYYNIIHLQ